MTASLVLNLLVATCIICWGAWGICDKVALKKASAAQVLSTITLFALPFMAGTFFYMNHTVPGWYPSPPLMSYTFAVAACVACGMLSYLLAMKMSDASLVLGATAAYTLFTQYGCWLFLHEPLVKERLLGSVLISVGVLLITGTGRLNLKGDRKSLLLILYMILACFFWGAVGVVEKKALSSFNSIELFWGKCFWELIMLFIYWAFCYFNQRPCFSFEKVSFKWIAASAFCLYVGSIVHILALSMATASYVVTISGCYPLIMYFLAILILKEPLNKQRLAGIVLVTLGGLLTQYTQAL